MVRATLTATIKMYRIYTSEPVITPLPVYFYTIPQLKPCDHVFLFFLKLKCGRILRVLHVIRRSCTVWRRWWNAWRTWRERTLSTTSGATRWTTFEGASTPSTTDTPPTWQVTFPPRFFYIFNYFSIHFFFILSIFFIAHDTRVQ